MIKKKAYVVFISYFTGPHPAGPTLGAAIPIPFGEEQPVYPERGMDLIYNTVDGKTFRGEVATVGVVEITENQVQVGFNIQINCVNSVMA